MQEANVPMPTARVSEFLFDDDNEEKMWVHAVTIEAAMQVLDHPFAVVANRKYRRAKYLVIGIDHQGRCLAIPIEETTDAELWRPITAWFCKKSEWVLCP